MKIIIAFVTCYLVMPVFINISLSKELLKKKINKMNLSGNSIIINMKVKKKNCIFKLKESKFKQVLHQAYGNISMTDSINFIIKLKDTSYASKHYLMSFLHNFQTPYVISIKNYKEMSLKAATDIDYIQKLSKEYNPVYEVLVKGVRKEGNELDKVIYLYIPHTNGQTLSLNYWFY